MSEHPHELLPSGHLYLHDARYHAVVYMIFAALADAMHNWDRRVQRG